jgi:SNF2 family DNA or RNA helicase
MSVARKTYGTAKLRDGQWHIECEPHVAIRLRRLFRKAGRTGRLKLAATDETSRDILWFTQRYPLEVEPKDVLEQKAQSFDERLEMFDSLLCGRSDPRDFEMALPPRHYQKIAAELALQSGGLLIGDDLGLGKTASAITMLTQAETRPALVVTLTHLPRQWAHEIEKFAPELKTHIIKKGTPYDITKSKQRRLKNQPALFSEAEMAPRFPDVVIVNYHKLAGWADALKGRVRSIIFDEIQELRRETSQKYEGATTLAESCEYRVGLSATPIYNYGIEFLNVMNVLRPGALGSRSEFIEEWCQSAYDINKAKIKNPKAFGTYVREAGLMVRRSRSDVGRELADLSKAIHYVDCDEAALQRLSKGVAELAEIILNSSQAWNERGQAARELDWKLRQATGIAKAPYVADFVKLLVESGEKVVLYGWHREVYSIWEDKLKDLGVVFYTGSESQNQKEAAKQDFINGSAQVLVMSLRSGAGLDGLQSCCRTVVFGELDWSPGVHEQAMGRIHRDGQTEPVVAYFLVSDEGSDPVVMDVLGVKKEQVDGIKSPNADVLERLETSGDRVKQLAQSYLAKRTKNQGKHNE